MAYGVDGYSGMGEHESTLRQKQAWAQQQAAEQQQQAANWNQGREMFERNLLGQEQSRKQYDSETARQLGGQKYSVLGGLLEGLTKQASGGGGYMGYYGMSGYMPQGGMVMRSRAATNVRNGSGNYSQG